MINILYLHAGSEMYGADKVLLELVTKLDKNKFHPIVVLPSKGKLSIELRKNNIETYVIEYPILRRKYFNLNGIIKYVKNYKTSVVNICKLVKGKKIHLIHVNTLAVLEGISLRRKLKVPLIWHIHEIIEKPKVIFKLTSFLVGRFSDEIVAVSNAVKKHLIDSKLVPKEKVNVIYNGIDNKVFYPEQNNDYLFQELNIPKNSIRIGMIGRVNAWKGQNDFLSAVSPLLEKYPNLYALIVGGVFEGEEWRMKQLTEIVEKDSNADRIRILGFRDDTSYLHNFFDVFMLPSTNPDPLPTVVLEAMACGKPVVGYRHGGIVEMVKDHENGLLADPLNAKALENLSDILIGDKQMRTEFGKNSLKRENEFFSMDSFIKKFSYLYMKLG